MKEKMKNIMVSLFWSKCFQIRLCEDLDIPQLGLHVLYRAPYIACLLNVRSISSILDFARAIQAFFFRAALAFAARFLLLLIMTTLKKDPTTAQPSKMRMTGIRMAQTRGGNSFRIGWSGSTNGCFWNQQQGRLCWVIYVGSIPWEVSRRCNTKRLQMRPQALRGQPEYRATWRLDDLWTQREWSYHGCDNCIGNECMSESVSFAHSTEYCRSYLSQLWAAMYSPWQNCTYSMSALRYTNLN